MTEIWAAVPTPMTADGAVDVDAVPAQARHLEANAIDGAFVTGTTGEFASLTLSERRSVIDAWAEHRGGLRIAAHVGSTVSEHAKELAVRAEEAGYEMVSAVAPFYGSAPDLRRVVDHLADTAAAAPGLDFCYYHIPSFTGIEHDVERIVDDLVVRVPTFAALKFTSPDLLMYSRLRESHPHLRIYFGQDELMPAALAMGAQGFIGSLYNVVGPIARATAELFAAGDVAKARGTHALVRRIAALAGRNGGLGFIKALADAAGPAVGQARPPWGPLSDVEREIAGELAEEVRTSLDALVRERASRS